MVVVSFVGFFDVVFSLRTKKKKKKNFPQKKSRRLVRPAYDTDSRENARACSFARVRTRNQVGARARVSSSSAFGRESEREREKGKI